MLKQFKMANGDEIICEVVQWPENEDSDLVVRKILKINSADNYYSSTKYYSLRPWLAFYDNINLLYVLNPFHILCEVEPSADLKGLYLETMIMIEEDLKSGKSKLTKVSEKMLSEQEAAEEIAKNNAELFESLIEEQYNLDLKMDTDSAKEKLENIVLFRKPKGTVH